MKPCHHRLLKNTTLALAILCLSLQAHANLILQLQASGYSAGSGTWTATVGPNAIPVGAPSTGAATPNGTSTVAFTGSNYFNLATALPSGSAYTAFVFANITAPAGPTTLIGGGTNSFQYRIYQNKQDVLNQGSADLGMGTASLNSTDFYNLDVTVSGSGGTFRLDGITDGTTSASGFSNTITRIGNNGTGIGEIFKGSIAEVRIYDTVLTDTERQAVEDEFTASYITPVPEPSSWVMMLGGLGMLLGFQRVRSARA